MGKQNTLRNRIILIQMIYHEEKNLILFVKIIWILY